MSATRPRALLCASRAANCMSTSLGSAREKPFTVSRDAQGARSAGITMTAACRVSPPRPMTSVMARRCVPEIRQFVRVLSSRSAARRSAYDRCMRVLLSSVFKPFAVDDEFGSRVANPVELYHNQVTREQGPFSLRMFHRTWSLMFLREKISAPCTVLDFPTRERFVRELTSHRYDVVGISAIVVNVGKVREMCRLVRLHSPHSTIVVGGHVTSIPDIEQRIDADHVVRGEGIAWLRSFLGEDPAAPIKNPLIPSSFGFRVMGLRTLENRQTRSATIVPS